MILSAIAANLNSWYPVAAATSLHYLCGLWTRLSPMWG